jgi:hypothetical protein
MNKRCSKLRAKKGDHGLKARKVGRWGRAYGPQKLCKTMKNNDLYDFKIAWR